MSASTSVALRGRDLVSPKLFDRLSARLATNQLTDREYAERIMDQALAFLAACGTDSQTSHTPSQVVDLGWHTFLLFTKDYAFFCRTVAGHFIHHVPDDALPTTVTDPARHASTIALIEQAGYRVDRELWTASAKCDPDRCSATGSDGNENTDTQTN